MPSGLASGAEKLPKARTKASAVSLWCRPSWSIDLDRGDPRGRAGTFGQQAGDGGVEAEFDAGFARLVGQAEW